MGIGYTTSQKLEAAKDAQFVAQQHEQNEKIIVNDSEQAKNDQAVINNLNQQIKELKDALPDPDSECFTADDVNKLQTIWKQNPTTRSAK